MLICHCIIMDNHVYRNIWTCLRLYTESNVYDMLWVDLWFTKQNPLARNVYWTHCVSCPRVSVIIVYSGIPCLIFTEIHLLSSKISLLYVLHRISLLLSSYVYTSVVFKEVCKCENDCWHINLWSVFYEFKKPSSDKLINGHIQWRRNK